MKHKRILLILLSLALLLSLFAGCKKDPPKEEDQPPEEKVLTLCDSSGASVSYNIIYSGSATEEVKTMVKDLQATVKEATGVVLKYSTDTSKLTVESPQEIIFGKTIREESTKSLAKITGFGYRIERMNEKIVITANNDNLLQKALEKFKSLFQVADGKLTVNLGLVKEEAAGSVFPLMVDGQIPFTVIIPAKGYSDALYDAAKAICDFFAGVTGQTFKVTTDDKVAETADAYEICIGNTNRSASQALYSELDGLFEYQFKLDGNRILVGAKLDTGLVTGTEQLYTDLARAIDGTYVGTPALSESYGGVFRAANISDDFQIPDDGIFKGLYDCGKDSYILYYQQVKEQSQYEAYVDKLVNAGAEVKATYTMGENLYTLLHHSTYTTYVSYLTSQKVLRIYIGSANDLNPSTEPVEDAALVTPKLWQFKIDVFAGGADGGMSYALQLTDGRYLVFDGGYSESDARELLATLAANKPASHEKPIVAGWFISHLHGDHYYGLQAMANNHASEIVVEAFYYNFPYVTMGSTQTITPGSASSVESSMKRWPTAKLYRKLHSGEDLHFSGADVKVICTLEDVFPAGHGDGNDTSTVVQISVAGQKILILGDAMSSESAVMTKLGRDVLKSDLVQFSHHGYDGASREVYVLVDPETVLWPMCILGSGNHSNANMFKNYYETNTAASSGLMANRWVRESESVKKVIVSGAGTECLNLPYQASGEKVVDYNAIYEQQLAEYEASKTN